MPHSKPPRCTHLADDVLDLCCDVVDAPDDDELVVRAGRHAQHRLPRPLRSRLPEEPRGLVVVPGEVGRGHCGWSVEVKAARGKSQLDQLEGPLGLTGMT